MEEYDHKAMNLYQGSDSYPPAFRLIISQKCDYEKLLFVVLCARSFLNEVQSRSSRNKMSVQNLATVFGPNILRAKADNPQSIMGGRLTSVLREC